MLALREIIQHILEKEAVLHEFVRQVDMRWGEMYLERPHFQQPGEAPHPDDDYTHASVRKKPDGFDHYSESLRVGKENENQKNKSCFASCQRNPYIKTSWD